MNQDERIRSTVSRRDLLRTGAAVGAAAAFGGIGAVPASAAGAQVGPPGRHPSDADLALVNGKIHTTDAENTVASNRRDQGRQGPRSR